MSRTHAVVTIRGATAELRDVGSSNGTFVNGRRVQGQVQLSDGDRIALGETEVVFRAEAPAVAVESTVRLPTDGQAEPPSVMKTAVYRDLEAQAAPGTDTRREHLPPPSMPGAPPVTRNDPPAPPPLPALPPSEPAPSRPRPPEPPPAPAPGLDDMPLHGVGEVSVPDFPPPAGFWIRFVAYLVDGFGVGLVSVGLSFVAGGPTKPAGAMIQSIAALVLFFVLCVGGWSQFGTTPGKRLFGLYVLTEDGRSRIGVGRAIVRWLGYVLNCFTLMIGFLMVGISASKRGLHDRMAGTYVGRRR